jgi:hypothetical protein
MSRLAEILAAEVEGAGPQVRAQLAGPLLERAVGPGAGDIAAMLQGLVDSMAPEDRRVVLAELLDLVLHGSRAASERAAEHRESPWPDVLGRVPGVGAGTREALLAEVGAGSRWQTVPLRLTVDQHEGLKQWCQANDFSMAVVLRGLVGRFLEDQERGARR